MKQQGVTLIELILTLVIAAILLVGVFSALSTLNRHSVDPLLQNQAVAIGQSYLDEIASQPYPEAGDFPCQLGTSQTPAKARSAFTHTCDYHQLQETPYDLANQAPFSSLQDYQVKVSIKPNPQFGGLANQQMAVMIEVEVLAPAGVRVLLKRLRADF